MRLEDGRGLGNPGVRCWQPTTSPGLTGGAITSAGRDLFNPFIQLFCEEFWPGAVVYKLGCALEAPGEL